ncbi:MAG TPA: diguanylate cyclase [Bryobacteraceae bacterium]|nr:diguanylate cyclase [Bryobacteraceae bacterium]
MRLAQLRIGLRLGLCFSIVVGMFTLVGALSIWQVHMLYRQTDRVDELDRQILSVLRADNTILRFAELARTAASAQDATRFQAEARAIQQELRRFMDAVDNASRAIPRTSGISAAGWTTLVYCRRAIEEQLQGMSRLSEKGDWSAIGFRLGKQVNWMENAFNLAVGELDAEVVAERTRSLSDIRRWEYWTYFSLVSLAVLIGSVSVAMAFLVTRSIADPLRKLDTAARALAAGNFDCRVSIAGENELATLARAFNLATTRLRDLYAALRRSEAYFRSLIENVGDPIFVVDESGALLYASPAASTALSIATSGLSGRNITEFLEAADRETIPGILRGAAVDSHARIATEFRWRDAGRSQRVLAAIVTDHRDDQAVRGFVINAHDVTERKAAEDRIRELNEGLEHLVQVRTHELEVEKQELMETREALRERATRDDLTGLWNRNSILEILKREIERGAREKHGPAIVLADIDHFKSVNDTFGHPVGDAVLREFSRRLSAAIRPYDSLGRYGGEEFLLVLPNWSGHPDTPRIEQLRAAVADALFVTTAGDLSVTCSFGLAWAEQGHLDSQELIRLADQALYRAKALGRNRMDSAFQELAAR